MAEGNESSSSSYDLFVAQKETAEQLPNKSKQLQGPTHNLNTAPSNTYDEDIINSINGTNAGHPVIKPLEIDLGTHKHSAANTGADHTYNEVNQMSPRIMERTAITTDSIPCKVYAVACYRIMLHVLLLYAVIGVSYLIFVQEKSSPFYSNNESSPQTAVITLTNTNYPTTSPTVYPSNGPTVNPSSTPSVAPTMNPSNSPTLNPTLLPSDGPSKQPTATPTPDPSLYPTMDPSPQPTNEPIEDPTFEPSMEPTTNLSVEPTIEPTDNPSVANVPNHYIGDYKFSAQNSSHGNWLLCDGSFVDPTKYPELFDIIGYTFGSSSSLFALPNAENRVIGVNGDSFPFGTDTGEAEVMLSENNLPSHWHYLAYRSDSQGGYNEANGRIYMGGRCISCIYGDPDYNYHLGGTSNAPDAFRSASVGSGHPVNIMQPTIYAGNLFIFAA